MSVSPTMPVYALIIQSQAILVKGFVMYFGCYDSGSNLFSENVTESMPGLLHWFLNVGHLLCLTLLTLSMLDANFSSQAFEVQLWVYFNTL